MGEAVTQQSVIGDEQSPGRIDVQASDGKQALAGAVLSAEIDNGRAIVGVRYGRNDTGRFAPNC